MEKCDFRSSIALDDASKITLVYLKGARYMKIEVWFDYVCPFCYLGKRHLDIALEELNLKEDVEIDFRSYQLNPEMEEYAGVGLLEHLSEKYNISLDEARERMQNVKERAKKAGLYYDFEIMKPTNTFDAHRLTKYAETLGKDRELAEKIFETYFEYGGLISDHDQLLSIADAVGINRDNAYEVLMDPRAYKDEVVEDIAVAKELGVDSVPFFLINKTHVVPESGSVETFVLKLQEVLRET